MPIKQKFQSCLPWPQALATADIHLPLLRGKQDQREREHPVH